MVEKNVESLVLSELAKNSEIVDSFEFSRVHSVEHNELVGHLKSLSMDGFVVLNQLERKQWVLTSEGQDYLSHGTPEFRLYQLIPEEGIQKDVLTVR